MSIIGNRELHQLTLTEQSSALAAGEVSSVELTGHCLARIDQHDKSLNSLISVGAEQALAAAAKADAARANAASEKNRASVLMGVPMVHKDIFCTQELPTTCGSRMLESYVSPFDATVVERLNTAGMVTLGKANMDEFAMGSSNENSYFGGVDNPWRAGTVPGGSSGGSAALVAARLASVATATDTGGSIRQPAAFCGVTGIKPTYGRVSRYGMIAFASSLDQGGVIAATAEDCAEVLQVMSGADPRDATCSVESVPDWSAAMRSTKDVQGLRIGVPEEFFADGLDEGVAVAVRAGLAELEALGATLVSISLPRQSLGIAAYYVVAPAEASSNLSRFDGVRFGHRCEDPKDLTDLYERSRAEGFGAEVQRRILIGAYVLSAGFYDAYYKKAQQVRQVISDEFTEAFTSVDLIAGPTTPTVAFNRGAKTDDPVAMYLNDLYTVSANLCGLPAASIPCGFSKGMPVGLQLIGRPFDEERLFTTAHAFQQATDWHAAVPETLS
jgi:aspartyl-tRNA(Asn)/glutamyl-tRNA(Gln) amidotransferase subunit A